MAKIFIIDDSEDLLGFVGRLLTLKKYEIRTAASRQDFNDSLVHFTPDLILLEAKVNGENGRQICKEIKTTKLLRHIPIILVSAIPSLLKCYSECKADDAIEKPFNLQDMINKINRHLNGRVYVT